MKPDLFRAAPAFELRAADDTDKPTVMVVNFARFGEWTEIRSLIEGHFMERFAPGAFTKTIQEQGDRIRALFQHGQDPTIGKKPLGPIVSLREKDDGAWAEVELLDTDYVRELIPGMRSGLYGASFQFKPERVDVNKRPARSDDNPDGIPEVTVREARLRELGPVTFGQYATATTSIRSLTDDFIIEQFAREHPDRIGELRELVTSSDRTPGDEPTSESERAPADTATPDADVLALCDAFDRHRPPGRRA